MGSSVTVPSIRSSSIIADVQLEKEMLANFWLYLNPFGQEHVEKSATFDTLLLLMFGIGHQNDREVCQQLAEHLIGYYQEFDIRLRPGDASSARPAESSVAAASSSLMAQISTGDDIKLVDNYLVKRKKAWPLHKFVLEFRAGHVKRSGQKMLDESSVERQREIHSSRLADPRVQSNKSL